MKKVDKISLNELQEMSEKIFGAMVKADVDIVKEIVVMDAELHADMEAFMLENGSKQEDLWGINLYPSKFGTDEFIEFDSMINIRPRQGNTSRYIGDEKVRTKIKQIIAGVVYE
jgi:hypothetical protein